MPATRERHPLAVDENGIAPSARAGILDSRDGAARVYRAYHRWLRLKRFALVAFLSMAAAFLFWAIPWLPSGLDTSDYTPELAFTTYLLGGIAITAVAAMGCQELARRNREGILAWGSVYDEATGLHNRDYLYDRIALECERAKRNEGVFSIVVFRVQADDPSPGLMTVAELIEGVTHRFDVIALLSDSELAVLSIGVGEEHRRRFVDRIVGTVTTKLSDASARPGAVDLRAGAATYGADGDDTDTLVQAARAATRRAPHAPSQAA